MTQGKMAYISKVKQHMDGTPIKLGDILSIQKGAAEEITSCNQLTKALRSALCITLISTT